MSTIQQIQKHIEDLERALADNATSVEFEGKKVTLDSAAGTLERIRYFKNILSSQLKGKSKGPRRTTVYTTGRKGL